MARVNISFELDDLPTPKINEEEIGTWIDARLNDARNLIVQQIQRGGGSGEYYQRGRGRGKRRSAPGEYPVTEIGTADAGKLANSIWYQRLHSREGVLYSDVNYSNYLTTGTLHMEPRLMLEDALRTVLENRPTTDRLAGAARIE
jgi:hypothetical protein